MRKVRIPPTQLVDRSYSICKSEKLGMFGINMPSMNNPPTGTIFGIRETWSVRPVLYRLSMNDPPTALVGLPEKFVGCVEEAKYERSTNCVGGITGEVCRSRPLG